MVRRRAATGETLLDDIYFRPGGLRVHCRGLAPALHVSKTNVNEVLKEGGRSGSVGVRARRWTGVLVVAELALTLVLLAGAGSMMRSFLALYRMDIGVDTSPLLMMNLTMPD